MTYLEMKRELISRIDTMTSGTSPGFSDYSYSLWLTEAQEELVSELLGEKITPTSKIVKRFDEDDLTRIGLDVLLSTISLMYDEDELYQYERAFRSKDLSIGGFKLPDATNFKVRHIQGEFIVVEDKGFENSSLWRTVKVKGVSHNYFLSNIDNPFKRPNKDLIWRIIKNQSIGNRNAFELVFLNTLTIKYYKMVVLRNQLPIIVGNLGTRTIDGLSTPTNSELGVQYHRTIIDKAVRIAQGVIKDPQAYQIANVEENK